MSKGLAAGMLICVTQIVTVAAKAQSAPSHAVLLMAVNDRPITSEPLESSSSVASTESASLFEGRGGAVGASTAFAPSRWDFFIGDSRWSPYGTVNGVRFSPLSQGIVGSVSYFKDKNLGIELQGNTQIPSLSEGSNGGSIGPVYRFATRFNPEVHASIGAQHFVGPIVPTYGGTSYYGNAPVWATTVAVGGSGDLTIPKTGGHFALRLQASYEYFHTSYGPISSPTYGGQVNVNSYLIDPGIVFRLGHAQGGVIVRKAKR